MKRILLTFFALLSFTFMMAQQKFHTIQSGETLESIAKKYKVSLEDLKRANPEAVIKLYDGMELVIPQSGKGKKEVDQVDKSETNYQPVQEYSSDYSSPDQNMAYSTSMIDNENNKGEVSRKNTWHFTFRLGPSFFKGEKNSSGTGKNRSFSTSNSTGYEVSLGAHYYFMENFYGSAMLGYYETYFANYAIQYGSSLSVKSSSKNIQLPIELGVELPISRLFGFILEAGPTLLYAVDGYVETNGTKKSFSEIEKDSKIDRFSAILKLGGGLKFGAFRAQAFYAIPLTKVEGGEKKGFWGITLGCEM